MMKTIAKPTKPKRVFMVSLAILGLSIIFSLTQGSIKLTLADIIATIIGRGDSINKFIIMDIRLPRLIMSILIGIGLATSGCIIQCIARNPLADTGLIGINAGAGLMVVLYIIFFGATTINSIFTIPIFGILGGILTALIVILLAYKEGEGITSIALVLTGVALQAGISAFTIITVIRLDDTQYKFVASWLAGQFLGSSWKFTIVLSIWVMALLPFAYYKTKVLDILNFGDDTALGLGVDVQKQRLLLLLLSVSLAAACVSIGGNIVFVGLIAPHLGRHIIGPKHQYLLPTCATVGATLVLLADTLGRIVIEPSSIPTGIMTAIIGAPYFIYLLVKLK